ncbi:MAG: hypothetical protein ACD_69C00244G0002 [uncultured bacterium]|nr:MAG: hypothetical protein ACD_69C00244G0002 [uncultured bacterium]OGT45430.1 MAG: hypothetical protein A3E83_00375 [Gammaproteobacteria bacterium RIFCSPHIGHO2_12_FULL_41_20]
MTQINLLPWREQARKNKKIRFGLTIAATLSLALFCTLIAHLYLQMLITMQQQRNAYLQTQLSQEQTILSMLNKKKQEQTTINSELHFIMSLRQENYQAIRLFDTLVRVIPEGISINKIARDGNNIVLLGKAQSNLQITLLMKNIAKTLVFKQPELTEITGRESNVGETRNFQIKVQLEEQA